MAALNVDTLKSSIKANMISKGIVKQTYDDNGNLVLSSEIPDEMHKVVDSIAEGVVTAFEACRATQVVTVPGVQVGAGSAIGTLLP